MGNVLIVLLTLLNIQLQLEVGIYTVNTMVHSGTH